MRPAALPLQWPFAANPEHAVQQTANVQVLFQQARKAYTARRLDEALQLSNRMISLAGEREEILNLKALTLLALDRPLIVGMRRLVAELPQSIDFSICAHADSRFGSWDLVSYFMTFEQTIWLHTSRSTMPTRSAPLKPRSGGSPRPGRRHRFCWSPASKHAAAGGRATAG